MQQHQNVGIDVLEGFLNQKLRFGTRNEDAGGTRNGDGSKIRLPNDVLQRFTLGPAYHGAMHASKLLRRHGLVEAHVDLCP